MLEPIFSGMDSGRQVTTSTDIKAPRSKPAQDQAPEPKRLAKRSIRDMGTPSIKDALNGKFNQENLSAKEQHKLYAKDDEKEDFTETQLKVKWAEFLTRLDDRPNLQSTLSNVPIMREDYLLLSEIENSVQEDLINGIKPELVSWLRRELRNSKIKLQTVISEKTTGRIIYTDSERYEEMVKKNPTLAALRQKFNLDFGD